MKFLVVLSIAVAYVAADASDVAAPVVRSSYDISPEGSYQYLYETGNGITAQVQGNLKNAGSEYPSLDVQGGWKYTAPDGTPVEITFRADENGYQPSGPLIPTPHPIPEAILRSLEYIRAHPPQEVNKVAKVAAF